MSLEQSDLARLRGLGERLDLNEVEEVYLPLSRLLHFYVEATHGLRLATSEFLGERPTRVPFVVGVAGSVAVGKSTTSRILKELMSRWPHTPRVELITTDGFLHSERRARAARAVAAQGFSRVLRPPRADALHRRGEVGDAGGRGPAVLAPHLRRRSPTRSGCAGPTCSSSRGSTCCSRPTVRPDGSSTGAISDYFDFSVYVDAPVEEIRTWYVERFLRLRETAFADPQSYFHRYAAAQRRRGARATAAAIWEQINEPNLVENVLPTRDRATLVLTKGADHAVTRHPAAQDLSRRSREATRRRGPISTSAASGRSTGRGRCTGCRTTA